VAVDAMRRGGDHFLSKPVDMQELDVFLRKCLEVGVLRRQKLVDRRVKKESPFYFGESPAMKEVEELAQLAAESESSVLILGETGTGKGVLGRWIHSQSDRSRAPLMEVNCSGLRGEMLASELFGHVKGAFTSAIKDKKGLVEVADGGTLFLDEIGDMDLGVQAPFLKVIEEKRYRRLGDVKGRRSDFRLICATHQDLKENVREGNFREDLFFRINIFPIEIPPLRRRLEDLPGLVRVILLALGSPFSEVPSPIQRILEGYQWPGNIRELKNVMERALMLARGGPLEARCFPGLSGVAAREDRNRKRSRTVDRVNDEYILKIMERTGGETKEAAALLGISRATLYRRLAALREKS
jgi:DNA-binding NtrC family response regulator